MPLRGIIFSRRGLALPSLLLVPPQGLHYYCIQNLFDKPTSATEYLQLVKIVWIVMLNNYLLLN